MKKKRPKNASLIAHLNPKVRQNDIDFDYLHKLSSNEKDYIARFMEEFNGASIPKKNRIHPKKKGKTPKGKKTKDEYKSSLEHKNNARNRDSFAICHAKKRLLYMNEGPGFERKEEENLKYEDPKQYENYLISLIDSKKKLNK
jgi:hypothetical protein